MDELREKCPWDKVQTLKSLRGKTIEEVYELSEAIIKDDNTNIEEELGDLLLHIIFYAKIGSERKKFNINSIINKLIIKLKNRHPHIYGKLKINTIKEVEENWEKIKTKEKNQDSILSNISKSLPALTKSMRIQEKVRAVGFDWDNKKQVMEKFDEEIIEMKKEIRKKNNKKKIMKEIGDVFFSLINYSRFIGIEPEEALENTNSKFTKRFKHLENSIKKEGKNLMKMNLQEMDKYWDKAKKETL
jgi:XTP/dITP diphosphohydrolase